MERDYIECAIIEADFFIEGSRILIDGFGET